MKIAKFALLACSIMLPTAVAAWSSQGWHSVNRTGEPMVTGSGRIVTQPRAVGNFSRVELEGASTLHVRLGAAPSLAIRADDNLLPYLTSNVVNGALKLDSRGSFRTRTTPQVHITVPNLDYVRSRGSGNVEISGLSNRHIELVTQGSGNIRAQGRTGHLVATVHGSGNVDMRGVAAGQAEISVMGSGNAWVATQGAVNARSFGSGNVYVLGRPSALAVSEAGSGKVIVRTR